MALLREDLGRIDFSDVDSGLSITADTALRLAKQFGTSADLWMNLQSAHDLAVACRDMAETG